MNKTIRVYGWHPITKEPLQGEFYADESPLEDDVYHLPQYTTKKPVPILTEHACALYDEASDDWLIVPDYRGETLYSKDDGEPFVIEKLGDIPENLTFLARPSKAHDWDGKQWVLNQAKQAGLAAQAEQQAVDAVKHALQAHIDSVAVGLGFSGGNAVMLYAGFANAFQSLAQAFGAWEAGIWVLANQYMAQVKAGEAPMLTPEQAVERIPAFEFTGV